MTLAALKEDLIRRCLLRGHFVLRSGVESATYFDKYQFESDPVLLAQVATELKSLLPPNTRVLAGLELGGVPLATALSLQTGLPAVFVRKAQKDYGTAKAVEGMAIQGRAVAVIEDVITSGGAVVKSLPFLKEAGAAVIAVLAVWVRNKEALKTFADLGVDVRYLYLGDDLHR
jgi:orotate phosphoribosyltransferase